MSAEHNTKRVKIPPVIIYPITLKTPMRKGAVLKLLGLTGIKRLNVEACPRLTCLPAVIFVQRRQTEMHITRQDGGGGGDLVCALTLH